MGDSQQTSPAQAQPVPIMKCCQKTDIRDCDCLKPQGSCQKPTNIFTHYDHQCTCYSCEWIREATQQYVPDRLGSGSNSSGTIKNCTYAGKQLDEVVNTEKSQVPNDIELVHSVMVAQGPPQKWGWVFRTSKQLQLPYLADEQQCPKTVMVATLDSNGRWKGIRHNEESFSLVHHLPPKWNTLYRDYQYSPAYSPYEHSADVPRPCDKMACTPDPMVPPNKLRGYSANDSNTTLVVGSIDNSVSKEDLQLLFECYGQIRYINRPDQTCAFIQFALRRDAMMAMRQLQGVPINRSRFRITWGDPKVRNPDEFEVREGLLRLKGNRHQKPQQPRDMGTGGQNFKIERPQYQFHHPPQAQVYQGSSGGGFVPQYAPPHGQVPVQQQMGFGYPPPYSASGGLPQIDEEAEPESEQTKPPTSDTGIARFTPEQKGKGQPPVAGSEGESNPPQGTRTPSREGQRTSGGSSPNASNRATAGSSNSGRTSPEEADHDEGGSKRGGDV